MKETGVSKASIAHHNEYRLHSSYHLSLSYTYDKPSELVASLLGGLYMKNLFSKDRQQPNLLGSIDQFFQQTLNHLPRPLRKGLFQ